jgi:putative hydrolase of the HAD superfamily
VDPWNIAGLELADRLASGGIVPAKRIGVLQHHPPGFPVGPDSKRGTQRIREVSSPRAIIFDGDDTLWLTEPLYDQARQHARAVVETAGVDGAVWEALERKLDVINVERFGHTLARFPTSCVEAYRTICLETGREPNVRTESDVRAAASEAFDMAAPLVPFAREALTALKARGYLLALLTKGDPALQRRRIDQSGLAPFFDSIKVVGHKTPEVIASMLKKLGVNPDSAWSVGNSLRSDIYPSLAAGVQPVWIDAHVWEYEKDHTAPIDERVMALADLTRLVEVAP